MALFGQSSRVKTAYSVSVVVVQAVTSTKLLQIPSQMEGVSTATPRLFTYEAAY
jgi:hypothetical protein